MALKSSDIFSVHGFPVGLVQCESNLLGILETGAKGRILGAAVDEHYREIHESKDLL